MSGRFVDSNVLLYMEGNSERAPVVNRLLGLGEAVVSAQVLNEIASVMLGKFRRSIGETEAFLTNIRAVVGLIAPLDEETHLLGMRIVRRYKLGVYDSMIVAAALLAGCDTLYTEDMHAGLVIEDRLTIVNPFA